MKRLLSVILALSMLFAVLPAHAAEPLATGVPSGVNVVYDLYEFSYGKVLSSFTYEETKGFLKYHSRSGGWNPSDSSFRTLSGYAVAYHNIAGQWYAMEINVPVAGEYDLALTYAARTSGSENMEVYLLDSAESTNVEANLNDKNLLGKVSCLDTANYAKKGTITKEKLDFPEAGKYVLVVRAATMGYTVIGKLTLNGGSELALMQADMSISDGNRIVLSGTLSDAAKSAADMSSASVTYRSLTPEIATVSDNGAVTVHQSGNAEIEADITYGKAQLTIKKTLAVESLATGVPSGVNVVYDLYEFSYGKVLSSFTYEETKGFLKYHSRSAGWNPSDSSFRTLSGYAVAYHNIAGQWYAMEINVPVAGEYNLELTYSARTSGSENMEVYLLDSAESTNVEANLNDKNLLGKVSCLDTANYAKKGTITKEKLDFPEAGKYVFVVRAATRGYTIIGKLTLNGGSELALMQADMSISGRNRIVLSGTLSDAAKSAADMSSASVTYRSLTLEIATVSDNGAVTVHQSGNAEFEADITYGKAQLTIKKTLAVAPPEPLAPAGIKLKYDFLAKSDKWTAPLYTAEPKRLEDIRGITYEYTDGNWQWHSTDEASFGSSSSSVAWIYQGEPWGRMRLSMNTGKYIALTIKVSKAGRYFASIETNEYNASSGSGDIYIIPYTDDVKAQLGEYEKLGYVNCLNADVTAYTPSTHELDIVEFPTAGEYIFVVKKARGSSGQYISLRSLTLDGENELKYIDFSYPSDTLHLEDTMSAETKAYLLDGSVIDEKELDIRYSSSDPDVATVSRDGTVTALSEGAATITVAIKYGSKTHYASCPITVIDTSGVKSAFIEAPESIYVTDRKPLEMKVEMNSGFIKTLAPGDVRYEIVSQSPEGIASIDSEGYLTAHGAGTVSVSAAAWYDGDYRAADPVEISLILSGKKSDMTIYTREIRDAVQENASKYTWARDEVKAAKELADRYADEYEYLYNLTIGEGVPRSRQVGANGDVNHSVCRYCGIDTAITHGGGGVGVWRWDMMTRPWKIQCPNCERIFPTNDFGSFYELGLVNGVFDRDVALAKHHEMFGDKNADPETNPEAYYGYGHPDGYLTNKLYDDLESVDTLNCGEGLRPGESEATWGVDDGWGYRPKEPDGTPYYAAYQVDGNGNYVIDANTGKRIGTIQEVHNHIAFYNYRAWQQERDILDALKLAYVYTGEEKYGRAGAIILDRVADVWPDMDTAPFTTGKAPDKFFVTDGGRGTGKIQGCINDCVFATSFTECADAFFPMAGDPFVVDFLSQKAEQLGLENKKESAYDIWRNWETGILKATYEGVKKVQIYGNFGQLQHALTNAAIALDSQPLTNEMLDFVYKSGGISNAVLTGGNVLAQLVDIIDRDGMNNEAAPNYNYIPPQRLLYVADVIRRYTDDEKYNMLENSKFVQMYKAFPEVVITSMEAAQIGDSGTTGGGGFIATLDDYILAYKMLRDTEIGPRLANYLWLLNGESADGLRYDITTEDPESLEAEVESLIDQGIGWQSEIMTGFGFAMLRSGGKYDTTISQNVNNKRGAYISFGKTNVSHSHADGLNIGIIAYDLNMTPDLGYPSNTGTQPERLQWISTTLSHNTVVVNEKEQAGTERSYPLHYDDAGKVKIVDVDSSEQYAETDIYRRTLVTVEVDDNDSYVVDFFRVLGGEDHLFSFHVAGDTIAETSLSLGEEEPGSYADPNWQQGPDPISPALWYYDTFYPRGYSWLHKTRRTSEPVGKYDIDFEIKDYKNNLQDSRGLHLRMTMLNDFDLNEVAIATGYPPTRVANKAFLENGIKYVLARRKGDSSLDSLFTTVYEPYKQERYLSANNAVDIVPIDGEPGALDTAKALKIEHKSGRVDYIMYATNNDVTYQVRDGDTKIDFRGFVGVYSVRNGENIYTYLSDGDIIGEHKASGSLTGEVIDFSRGLGLDNYIVIKPDAAISPEALAGKLIVVDNDMVQNGAYHILGAEATDDGNIKLDLGTVSVIRKYKNADNLDGGFVYNINAGQSFTVGNSYVDDMAPEFAEVSDNITTSAGSSVSVVISASSESGNEITYELEQAPRGAVIDPRSGTLTWKPDASQVGVNHFAVMASDEFGRYNVLHFDITVYGSTTGTSAAGSTSGGGGGGGVTTPGDTATNNTDNNEKTDDGETPSVGDASSSLGEGALGERFIDLGNHAWAADAINTLASDGIIKGTTATTFSPAANITRADYAILLVRAFGLESDDTTNFDDVLSSDYFAAELAIARNTGIVNGIGDNKYAPRNTITRQDMMVIMYRALEKLGKLGDSERNDTQVVPYADFDSVADYAKEAVSYLIANGFVNGKNGLIAPTDYTTRAEVAVLLRRILDYTAK